MYGTFHIFYEEDLRDYLGNNEKKVRNKILNESEDYILNVNEDEYIEFLVDKFQINPLEFDFENIYGTEGKKDVPGKYLHNGFFHENKTYERSTIIYHIPFTGNKVLLKCKPDHWIMWVREVFIRGNYVCFEIVNFNNDYEEVKRESETEIRHMEDQNKNCYNQIQKHNQNLYNIIKSAFKSRKKSIISKNEGLNSLNIPIKKNNSSETYTIPSPKIKSKLKIKPKTEINKNTSKQDPTLDDSSYQKIIEIINDVGKSFEKYPHNYVEKSEEHLRDYILSGMQTRIEGSTTGETFNKKGKTDILLKHENENIFIAECKIWKGKQYYLDAITQLIGYLTWRDSKTAIILFVKNKNISSVLNNIEEYTPNHPNFVEYVNNENESWFNYIFHMDGDTGIKIKTTVLVIHIPQL